MSLLRRVRNVAAGALLSSFAFAQVLTAPVTLPTISGNGAVTAIPTNATARWITFFAPSTNSTATCSTASIAGCPRIGDNTISTTRGYPILPGQSAYLPESPGSVRHQLNAWYYLVQSGDSLIIQYGQ